MRLYIHKRIDYRWLPKIRFGYDWLGYWVLAITWLKRTFMFGNEPRKET